MATLSRTMNAGASRQELVGFSHNGSGVAILGNAIYACFSVLTTFVCAALATQVLDAVMFSRGAAWAGPAPMAFALGSAIPALISLVIYARQHSDENHSMAGFFTASLLLLLYSLRTALGFADTPYFPADLIVAQFVVLMAITLWDKAIVASQASGETTKGPTRRCALADTTQAELGAAAADDRGLRARAFASSVEFAAAQTVALDGLGLRGPGDGQAAPRRGEPLRRRIARCDEDYMQTDHWQSVRWRALTWADHRCQLCNSDAEPLHVHHRTYERLGQETGADLVVLCERCHSLFRIHRRLARPMPDYLEEGHADTCSQRADALERSMPSRP